MMRINRVQSKRRSVYKAPLEVHKHEAPHIEKEITVSEALSTLEVIYDIESYRENTIQGYVDYFKEFDSIVGKSMVTQITKDDVRRYIRELIKVRRLSPVTVNIRLASLKSMFNRLVEEEIIKVSPFKTVRKLRTDEARIFMLSDEQVNRLLSVIDINTYVGIRDRACVNTGLSTGIRANEIEGLKIRDINFEERIIYLTGEQNKSRRSRRVPFTKKLAEELKRLIAISREKFGDDVEYVFLSYQGKPFRYERFRKRMAKYAKDAGIHKECRASPHSLRHTFAVRYLTGGGDLGSLRKILGHSELESTEVYLRYTDETVRDSYDRVFGSDV